MPYLRIVNTGADAVPLSELTLRYWYTADGAKKQNWWCDWAAVGNGNIKAGIHPLPRPVPLADHYLEINFTPAAGSIKPAGDSGEIQFRLAKDDWSRFDQANDYSFDPSKTAYADWSRITLYRNGVLVWGQEPDAGAAPVGLRKR
jgi:hypothetical protein